MNIVKRLLGIKSPSEELEKAVRSHPIGNIDLVGFNDLRVIEAYPELWSTAPLHFTDKHFTATTIEGRVFLYCPVGNICSWSQGDVQHRWCEWCKKSFEEMNRS